CWSRLLSTGRTATISVTIPITAPPASTSRNPIATGRPMRAMNSEPNTPPSIPSVPAVKLKTREAENNTLHVTTINAQRQPIAVPDRTIDETIVSRAVAGRQLERAALERIGLDHHHFLVRVAVVTIGCERNVAVDAGEFLELI